MVYDIRDVYCKGCVPEGVPCNKHHLRAVHVDAGEDALLGDVDDCVDVYVATVDCAEDERVDGKQDEGVVDEDLAAVA